MPRIGYYILESPKESSGRQALVYKRALLIADVAYQVNYLLIRQGADERFELHTEEGLALL